MIETEDLMRAAIEATNAKRVAQAMGLTRSYVYRWQRHPMDEIDPDGTGAANPLDRIEALADLLAAHPEKGRPVLQDLRLWTDALFARVLGATRGTPLTESSLLGHAASVMREVSELVANADPRTLDQERRARLRREAVDVLAVVQALVCDIDAEDGAEGKDEAQDRRLRPTG